MPPRLPTTSHKDPSYSLSRSRSHHVPILGPGTPVTDPSTSNPVSHRPFDFQLTCPIHFVVVYILSSSLPHARIERRLARPIPVLPRLKCTRMFPIVPILCWAQVGPSLPPSSMGPLGNYRVVPFAPQEEQTQIHLQRARRIYSVPSFLRHLCIAWFWLRRPPSIVTGDGLHAS